MLSSVHEPSTKTTSRGRVPRGLSTVVLTDHPSEFVPRKIPPIRFVLLTLKKKDGRDGRDEPRPTGALRASLWRTARGRLIRAGRSVNEELTTSVVSIFGPVNGSRRVRNRCLPQAKCDLREILDSPLGACYNTDVGLAHLRRTI
jgi:hypothetical protein